MFDKWDEKIFFMYIIRRLQLSGFKNKKYIQWIKEHVITSGCALDVCCGPGLYPSYLLFKSAGVRYTGVDINGEYLRQARLLSLVQGLDGVFVHGDATKLFFHDRSFDQVWLFNWWGTGENIKVLDEVSRVLKDEGTLLINHSFFIDYSPVYSVFREVASVTFPYRNKHSFRSLPYKFLEMKKK